jgi:hypothetical protein
MVYGIVIFGIVIFLISKIGSSPRQLPTRPQNPEPLTSPQRAVQDMPEANFDSAAFQTARQIIGDIERFPDPQAKTMALADYLHRLETRRNRAAEREKMQTQQELDIFDRAMQIADRFGGGRAAHTPPPQQPQSRYADFPEGRLWEPREPGEPRRINNWDPTRRQIHTPPEW